MTRNEMTHGHLTHDEVVELDHQYLMQTGKRLPVTFVRGEGVHLYDNRGKEYLDLMAGIAVNILGHCHPAVVEAVVEQSRQLIHTSGLYYQHNAALLARRLVQLAFPSRVFLNNSGAESNEVAIKIARKWGKRNRDGAYEIISALGSFHGRTLATIAATGQEKYQKPFAPMPDGFVHVPYDDLDAIKAATNERTVAVMLEPIMGEIGIIVPSPDYLKGVRQWCDEQNLLLILDEIQTGMGRTGRWFAHQLVGVEPDIMTLAKALGGGLPIGACLAKPRADVLEPGDHGTTFGGNPVVTAAALATIDVVEREHLLEHVVEVGDLLQAALEDLGQTDARGIGMMRAFTFAEARAKDYQVKAMEAGVIVNAVDDYSIRVEPPLILSANDVDQAAELLKKALP